MMAESTSDAVLDVDNDTRSGNIENEVDENLLARGHNFSDHTEMEDFPAMHPTAESAENETKHLVPIRKGLGLVAAELVDSYPSLPRSTTKSVSFCNLNLKPETNPYPVHPLSGPQKLSRKDQLRLMKDLFVVSVAFMLLFSAFNGIQNMASSLFQDKGLGVISYSIFYASGITSSFLTPIILKKLTPKWSLVLSYVLTCLFLGSLLYPKMYTVIPCSILLGLTNGPLWAAAVLYVSSAAFEYASLTGKTVAPVVSRFHGIWMTFQQFSQVSGNLVSSLVFQLGDAAKPESYYGRVCGAAQCPVVSTRMYSEEWNRQIFSTPSNVTDVTSNISLSVETNNTLNSEMLFKLNGSGSYHHPTHDLDFLNKIYILGGVYISLVVVAIILFIAFLRAYRNPSALKEFGSNVSLASVLSDQATTSSLLLSAFKLWKRPNMLLSFPMAYLTGAHQAYLYADFTQAFVSCTIGVSWVGYTMICFGLSDVIFCYLAGKLNQYVGRITLYSSAFVIHTALIITLVLWAPSPNSTVPFFIIPALWGVCDAVWQPQTTALLSTLFPRHQDASFANYRMFHCLGFAVTFGYSQALCINVKFYIFQTILILAFICYIALEMRLRKLKCLFSKGKESSKTIIGNRNSVS